MNPLVGEADGCCDRGQLPNFFRRVSCFLRQFPTRALDRIFARHVEFARRNFQRHALDGISILLDENDVAVGQQRHHRRRSGVSDPLARCLVTVGQLDSIAHHVQQHAVENFFARQLLFDQFFVVHSLSLRSCILQHSLYSTARNCNTLKKKCARGAYAFIKNFFDAALANIARAFSIDCGDSSPDAIRAISLIRSS